MRGGRCRRGRRGGEFTRRRPSLPRAERRVGGVLRGPDRKLRHPGDGHALGRRGLRPGRHGPGRGGVHALARA